MIGFDGKGKATQAVGTAHAQRPVCFIGCRCRGALETIDGVVDLRADVRTSLRIIVVRL